MLLLAIVPAWVPAWVPGSQQDAHGFLLSIFQKFLIKRIEVSYISVLCTAAVELLKDNSFTLNSEILQCTQ